MERKSFELVEDAFNTILSETIDILNGNRDQAAQKLVDIESSISVVHNWFEKSLERTKSQLREQQSVLEEMNDEEARLMSCEKRLGEIELELSARLHGLNNHMNALNARLVSLDKIEADGERQLEEIEKTKRDAKTERDYPIVGSVYMAVRDRNWKMLFESQTQKSLISTIIFEKHFVKKDIKKAREEMAVLENELKRVENEAEMNRGEKERVAKTLLVVKERIDWVNKFISEKGQMVTARNKVMNGFKIMHSRLARIKDSLLLTSAADDKGEIDVDDDMKGLVELVFKAQRGFLILENS